MVPPATYLRQLTSATLTVLLYNGQFKRLHQCRPAPVMLWLHIYVFDPPSLSSSRSPPSSRGGHPLPTYISEIMRGAVLLVLAAIVCQQCAAVDISVPGKWSVQGVGQLAPGVGCVSSPATPGAVHGVDCRMAWLHGNILSNKSYPVLLQDWISDSPGHCCRTTLCPSTCG